MSILCRMPAFQREQAEPPALSAAGRSASWAADIAAVAQSGTDQGFSGFKLTVERMFDIVAR